MTKSEYWEKFWVDYGEKSTVRDAQTQVLRTLNKKPIDNQLWQRTLGLIIDKLSLKSSYCVVDLCCGNGLISTKLAPLCKSVISVDVSSHLLSQIDLEKNKNITIINKNILELELPSNSFEIVLLYAGLQYFDNQEVIEIFRKAFEWLKPGGIFYVGDIPDHNKLWSFFSNEEREFAYFDSLKKGEPIVGNWFEVGFLEKLGRYTGFSSSEFIEQSVDMIYSFFRFDMRFKK